MAVEQDVTTSHVLTYVVGEDHDALCRGSDRVTRKESHGRFLGLIDDPDRIGIHDLCARYGVHKATGFGREDDLVAGFEEIDVAERARPRGSMPTEDDVADVAGFGGVGPPAHAAIEGRVGDAEVDGGLHHDRPIKL